MTSGINYKLIIFMFLVWLYILFCSYFMQMMQLFFFLFKGGIKKS